MYIYIYIYRYTFKYVSCAHPCTCSCVSHTSQACKYTHIQNYIHKHSLSFTWAQFFFTQTLTDFHIGLKKCTYTQTHTHTYTTSARV